MKPRLALALLLMGTLLVGCKDQYMASYGGAVNVGDLPQDICYKDGKPLILSVSIEETADIDLAYINVYNELVVQKYGNRLSLGTEPQGRLIWKGVTIDCTP